jgi:hypothetical protein
MEADCSRFSKDLLQLFQHNFARKRDAALIRKNIENMITGIRADPALPPTDDDAEKYTSDS